jgi:hypothetical protein
MAVDFVRCLTTRDAPTISYLWMTMNKNTLKKETAGSSKLSIPIYQTALLHITYGINLNIRRHGSVESQQQINS